VTRQASIVGYGDAFMLLTLCTVPCVFLLPMMRRAKVAPIKDPTAHAAMD
jgi:hypothetical protein